MTWNLPPNAGLLRASLLGAMLIAVQAQAQSPRHEAHALPGKQTAAKPPAKPLTDWERATLLAHKRAYDQACPLFERATHSTTDNAALWNDLSQCEWHRGHRKRAIEAGQRAVVLGDRNQRKTAYGTLRAAGAHVDLPDQGCEWLPVMPGTCNEQMWACAYDWTQQIGALRARTGHSLTFGVTDDERDVLEQALRDGTALKDQLAMEWKALTTDGADEKVCTTCHARAAESADGLVNARAASCFLMKTGRPPPADVCVRSDSDCDVYSGCLDDASAAAQRAERSRAAWPEVYDVVSAAHKICDATCGVVTKTHCQVLSLDACRGFVGYACVMRGRGKRPEVTIGEIAVDDPNSNWSEIVQRPRRTPSAAGAAKPGSKSGARSSKSSARLTRSATKAGKPSPRPAAGKTGRILPDGAVPTAIKSP